jgi:two-component system response regulator DctR
MNLIRPPKPTIYVVDDDRAGRESLCDLLESQGFVCAPFASAEEFLAGYDEAEEGCVITDYKMPGMSGVELQAELAERKSLLPVIVVSGFADVPVAVRAMQLGAVTLLQKPLDCGELLAAIDAALALAAERRRSHAQAADLTRRLSQLSSDERSVMDLLLEGRANKAIAKQLDIGLRTVERRRQLILEKMNVNSLPELAALLAGSRRATGS